MPKITFIGAGSTVFAKNVLGDCMMTEVLSRSEIALYDIDPKRLEESKLLVEAMNKNCNENKLQELAKTALKQINDKKYDTELKSKGVKTIYKYGVAFSGKHVAVEAE